MKRARHSVSSLCVLNTSVFFAHSLVCLSRVLKTHCLSRSPFSLVNLSPNLHSHSSSIMSLSKMSLSTMPSEVLSAVINNRAMPLSHRLRLRVLSARWSAIIEDGLKKETSLVLRERNFNHLKPKPSELILQSADLTDEFLHLLYRFFPALTQLTVFFRVDAWKKLPLLLAQLGTNLKTVKLHGRCQEEIPVKPIADALNALPGLTSLALHVFDRVSLLPHLAPTLSRLEKFAFPNTDWDQKQAIFLSSSLSSRCTHLMLDDHDFVSFNLNATFFRQLSASLRQLHLVNCRDIPWKYLFRLHNMTSLTFHFFSSPQLDSSLLDRLSLIKRLTEVKLYRLSCWAPLALPSETAPPLTGIKRLSLCVHFLYCSPDYKHFFLAIRAWFPTLLHLTFIADPDIHSAIGASLSNLPFTVELLSPESVDFMSPSW